MTPPELEFNSLEIFNAFRESQDLVCPGECDSNDALAIVINRLLAEKLAKCKVVYELESGCSDPKGYYNYWSTSSAIVRTGNQAHLVGIKEIEK